MSVSAVSQNLDPNSSIAVRRALISVSDKTGLIDLAKALAAHGVELVSTGGTHKALADAGLKPKEISELTGFPEGLGGRVKTLHPFVHGGLLARRGLAEDEQFVAAQAIPWIDLLICNLYPFEKVTSDPACPWDTAIENIDIGGPAMVRSAAKNHAHVPFPAAIPRNTRPLPRKSPPERGRFAGQPAAGWPRRPLCGSPATMWPSPVTSPAGRRWTQAGC